jgi:hyaluronan synthase
MQASSHQLIAGREPCIEDRSMVAANPIHMSKRAPLKSRGAGIHRPWEKAGIVVAALAFAVIALCFLDVSPGDASREALGAHWRWFLWPALAMSVLLAVATAYRTVLWWRYRPMAPVDPSECDLPTVLVVIPAFNEGPMVARSIRSALASDYPTHLLRVVAVDDGSVDDTWEHICRAARRSSTRVATLRFPHNRGKRHAVHAGVRSAPSEIVVTLDSDSELPPHSLRHLIAPLVADSQVGGVAGCVKVHNRDATWITRMLGVRYILGFDYTRAHQSMLNNVLVCPGALSAWRREAIDDSLDAWLHQRFLGNQCTNGDDHALTNIVLRKNLATRYQSSAEAFTIVPERYAPLSRMLVRWARSNTRESWMYLQFALGRARNRREGLALLDACIHALQIPAQIYLSLLSLVILAAAPSLLIHSLTAATLFSGIYLLYFLRSERSTEALYGVLYAWFALLSLGWVLPWAALTVGSNNWLTRALPSRPTHGIPPINQLDLQKRTG